MFRDKKKLNFISSLSTVSYIITKYQKTMKKLLFIGDSFTAGENNNFISYAQYLDKNYDSTQIGVAGTTIGEYSLYLVDGFSLLSQIQRYKDDISKAGTIFLEYGINDISSMLGNKVSYQQILDKLDQAISTLNQINPNAKIKFLVLSLDNEVIISYANNHHEYLTKYFYPDQDINHIKQMWADNYIKLIKDISNRLETIPMILNLNQLKKYFAKNTMHPSKEGYKQIANNINLYLLSKEIR